jgi:hypothetical protein
MSQSLEKKKFLNVFDYLLMPFVIAVALAALFQGVFSQIYFFSDLLTNETISDNSCYQDFSDWCSLVGNEDKLNYRYELSLPVLSFLFGRFQDIKDVEFNVIIFEALLVAYVWFRVKKYIERKRKYRE